MMKSERPQNMPQDNNSEGRPGFLAYAAAFVTVIAVAGAAYFIWGKYSGVQNGGDAGTQINNSLPPDVDNGSSTSESVATSSVADDSRTTFATLKDNIYQILGLRFDAGQYVEADSSNNGPISLPGELPGNQHVLISEVMPGQALGDSAAEFVELYNPTDQKIDLTGYSLKRANQKSDPQIQVLADSESFNGKSIGPNGYFLIASSEYKGDVVPDTTYSSQVYRLSYDNDTVLLYSGDKLVDSAGYVHLDPGESLVRKALPAGTYNCVSALGDGASLGNGCDTNTPHDFEISQSPNPKNSQSLQPKEDVPD